MNITLDQAEVLIASARAAADRRRERVSLAVVDAGGNLVAFGRTDAATLITIDTAIGKAYTAVAFGFDTSVLPPFIQPGQPLFGAGWSPAGSRSMVPLAGGVLVRGTDQAVSGALGVSGAMSSQTDHEIGVAALAASRGGPEA